MTKRAVAILGILLIVAVTACGQRGRGRYGSFEDGSNPPLAKSAAEKKVLGVLEEIPRSGRVYANVPMSDGRILRLLAEAVGAKHVVEIGTSTGYSGLWFCLALQATGGKLTTFEYDAGRAKIARQHFQQAGVEKLITLIEGDAHQKVTTLKEPIDVLFIDADKDGYADYLNKLLPLVRPGGLIIAHNVTQRGVSSYNEAVTKNPDLETIFDFTGGGLGVTLKKR